MSKKTKKENRNVYDDDEDEDEDEDEETKCRRIRKQARNFGTLISKAFTLTSALFIVKT